MTALNFKTAPFRPFTNYRPQGIDSPLFGKHWSKLQVNKDRMVQAIFPQRNTPDPGCKLSPAQILMGRILKDKLPYIKKCYGLQ